MNILSLPANPLASSNAAQGASGSLFGQDAPDSDTPSFSHMLENSIGQVNSLQNHATQAAESFARGQTSDVHSVMIASEQATISLQMTAQIRNKAVDAYQEIMRISM